MRWVEFMLLFEYHAVRCVGGGWRVEVFAR